MKTVAFGPERDVPSWNWVGFDTARVLSQYFNIVFYDSIEKPPEAEIVVCIKQRPEDKFIEELHRRRQKFVYVPIDFYQNQKHFRSDTELFRKCDMISRTASGRFPCFVPTTATSTS